MNTLLETWAAASVPAGFLLAAVIGRAERHRTADLQAAMRRHPAGKAGQR